MSAYALPGLFFLSCPQAAGMRNEKKETAKLSMFTVPKDAADSATVTSSSSSTSAQSNDVNDQNQSKEPSWYRRQKHNLYVTIKSASIDPTRLIQTFTNRRGSVTKNGSIRNYTGNEQTGRNRDSFLKMLSPRRSITCNLRSSIESTCSMDSHFYGAEGDLDEIEFNSPPSSPTKTETTRISIDHITIDGEEHLPARASFYGTLPVSIGAPIKETSDDAVQFTLSIDFNDRKYTAMRSLPLFIKLREDIVRELANSPSANPALNRLSHDRMFDDESLSSDDQDMDEVNQFSIPELPIGQGNFLEDMELGAIANVGFAGRGFTRLQAMMTSYCPVMEEWLHSVTNLVPDSPSLHDFLWEPMLTDTQVSSILSAQSNASHSDNSDSNAPRRSLKNSLRSSVSTLCSIDESSADGDDSHREKKN